MICLQNVGPIIARLVSTSLQELKTSKGSVGRTGGGKERGLRTEKKAGPPSGRPAIVVTAVSYPSKDFTTYTTCMKAP
jgi:hypothetical protein